MRVQKQDLAALPDRTLTLLSEITASTSRHAGGDDDEAALMRIRSDPLLLRQHLKGTSGTGSDSDGLAHRLNHDLQSRIFFSGAVADAGGQIQDHRYPPLERSTAESLRPEPFAATQADMTLALDNTPGPLGYASTPHGQSEAGVSTLVIGACLQILMAVLAVAVLADVVLG